jgi:glycosyltransferase involved in cell wall biosynthesis
MLRVGYLFERFPSFGQTFCYREVAELERQGAEVTVFAIRQPTGEPAQDWDADLIRRVNYLPEEAGLVKEVDRAMGVGQLPSAAKHALEQWDRQPDFLRLYQAAYVGLRLQDAGINRLHAHFAGMAARTAYWIREFFGIEYSLTAHANDIFAPRDFVVSLAKILDGAAAIITVSDFAVDYLSKHFPQSAAKIHRVYNGVDLTRFRQAEFTAPVPLILSVGRLIDKKGFGDLITACALLKARGCGFRCEMVGEGPLEQTLSGQIAGTQLARSVKLTGPRTQSEIGGLLAAATVFVLPCTTEAGGGMDNLPTVIMEAMAAGLPIVSTPVGGVPEMVQPGLNGELVPPGNPTALADALEAIISQPDVAARLGARGRELAAEKFSIEANVRSLAALLGNP